MNIQIHSLKFDADKKLLDFVRQKVNKLTLLSDDIVSAEVFLRLDHDEERENKITEIKVEYPRGPLFARKQSKTFEEATDHVVAALKRQIVKQKGKMRGE
jgi:putative sigma-54 modulation protein